MSEIKIEFNSDGFRQILTSAGVKDAVESAANSIKDKATSNLSGEFQTDGYKVTTMIGGYGGGRYVSFVQPVDHGAMLEEAEHKTLVKAVK